ncbi:MAG: ArnT family glycosyltransferase [Candidatus Nanosalina sp.]
MRGDGEKMWKRFRTGIKENRIFVAFLTLFTVTQLVIVLTAWRSPLVWDSAVYAGMGKRLLSGWKYGIWEVFRPLMLPVVLGVLWKAGMPLVGFPRAVALLISVAGISAMYWMLKDLFDSKMALYSTAILMTSTLFFKFSHYVLTGAPSSFLVFAGAYYAQKGRDISSGFLTSLGFLTRFPAAIAAPGISIFLFLRSLKNEVNLKSLKPPLAYSIAFFITTIPYFAFNKIVYGEAFRPLIIGATIPAMNPEKYFYGVYYILEVLKTQPLMIFMFAGLYVVFKERNWSYGAFFSSLLFTYGFFTLYSHKLPRFALLFLPLISVFAGRGVVWVEKQEVVDGKFFRSALGILLVLMMLVSFSISYSQSRWTNEYRVEFLNEVGELEGVVAGNDPVAVLYGNFEFVPIRPENLEETYSEVKNEADYYAFNSCAWYCTPAIENCSRRLEDFKKMMQRKYDKKFYSQGYSCNYTMYRVNRK